MSNSLAEIYKDALKAIREKIMVQATAMEKSVYAKFFDLVDDALKGEEGLKRFADELGLGETVFQRVSKPSAFRLIEPEPEKKEDELIKDPTVPVKELPPKPNPTLRRDHPTNMSEESARWHKDKDGKWLGSSRPVIGANGKPAIRHWRDENMANAFVMVASGENIHDVAKAFNISDQNLYNYRADIDLIARLPQKGDARMRWLVVRYGIGTDSNVPIDKERIESLIWSLLRHDIDHACTYMGLVQDEDGVWRLKSLREVGV